MIIRKKYPFWDGLDKNPVTRKQAFKRVNIFIGICRKMKVQEKSYHLYLQDNHYRVFANSVKYLATGKHIKEFKL